MPFCRGAMRPASEPGWQDHWCFWPGIRAVPKVGIRAVPKVGIRAVPKVGIRAVPKVGIRAVPKVGIRAVPKVGVPLFGGMGPSRMLAAPSGSFCAAVSVQLPSVLRELKPQLSKRDPVLSLCLHRRVGAPLRKVLQGYSQT